MKVVRSNMFETNSSSVHAIVVNPSDVLPEANEIKDLYFELGEFGWEVKVYQTTRERASYLWTAICRNCTEEERYRWCAYLDEVVNSKYPDVKLDFQQPKDDDFYYVDHVSDLDEWLRDFRDNPEHILIFLFGEHSEIRTGNDNGYDDDNGTYISESPDTDVPEGYRVYVKGN